MAEQTAIALAPPPPSRRLSFPLIALLLVGASYEAVLLFTSLLAPYRFPIPYAVPIFDGPFAFVGIGIAYLCLERQRLRQDARSAWVGLTLWVTALLALAHIATQPDYPGSPGVSAGIAPYFFFLSYLGSFVGIGLAVRVGDRPFALNDRQRVIAAFGGFVFAVAAVVVVLRVQEALPSMVMKPGRLTPFFVWSAVIVIGGAAIWALTAAQRRLADQRDWFGQLSLLAGTIWVLGLLGLLIYPYRYGVSWYVAGFARPIGVGVIFIGLLREQVWLYREARARVRALETVRTFGQELLRNTSDAEILSSAARAARDLMRADASAAFLADATGGALRLEAGAGWMPGTVGTVAVPTTAESFAGYAYRHKEIVHVDDLSAERRFSVPSYLATHGIRAGTSVPLGLAAEPFGVLATFHRHPREISEDERRLLANVADHTALALEKARLYTELQANLAALQETQAQLIQADKLKALGTLLSGVAHELNNPLSTIQLTVQLLKRGELGDLTRRRLDVVEEECERASRIIRDLLMFARRRAPERKLVDLNRVITGVVKLQTPEFEMHRLRVVTELEPLPAIMADAHQLQQVFLNLCTNATHAMKRRAIDGTLTIRSTRRDHEVVVEVEDTGPGIPPENLGRIFDPFFTTKSAGEGTGLGLSLSIGIVQAHGGRMQATNVPRGGARFTVTLPIGETAAASERPEAPRSERLSRHGTVLVVDDEVLLRKTLAEVLTSLGHTVEVASTGREALTLLARERFDVVTLDLRLPDVDGKAVWRELLTRDAGLAARVVFVTGDTMSPDTQKFLQQARRPVLTKPLTIESIGRVVAEVLEAERPPSTA